MMNTINSDTLYTLLTRVKNVAQKRITNLSNNLDADTLHALLLEATPTSIGAIAKAVEPRSILLGRSIAVDMVADWNATLRYEFDLLCFLQENRINRDEELKLARKIALLFKEKVLETINTNPYLLVRFFSFNKIDNIGSKLMSSSDSRRLLGLADSIIKNELNKGNTALRIELFVNKLLKTINEKDIRTCIEVAEQNKKIEVNYEKGLVHFFGAHNLEKFVQKTVDNLASNDAIESSQNIESILKDFQDLQTFPLSDEQREAVANASKNQFHIILGYAGTGKSTSLNALVYTLERLGRHIEMAALSGKAALKMSESSGVHAKTIFRFLKQVKESKELKQTNEPIPKDFSQIKNNTTIILDESSMIDLGNFANILRHLKSDSQIILLGDNFQLPPISFGLVFHSLVEDKRITSKLSKVFRQADGNNIPLVGEEIRNHKSPILGQYNGVSAGISFLETESIDTITIEKIATRLGGFDVESANLQLIGATNKTVGLFNSFMHNNYSKNKAELFGFLSNVFSIGDAVVYNQNNYKRNLFNGILGYVTNVQTFNNGHRKLSVRFEDIEHEFENKEISNISLAYCLTCHKLQGSQADNVIIVLEDSNLIEPTWFYTAITRAKKQVVVVGSKRQYENIFKRKPSYLNRTIGLKTKSDYSIQ